MKKLFFAIGHQSVENFIIKQMENKIEVVGVKKLKEISYNMVVAENLRQPYFFDIIKLSDNRLVKEC